MKIDLHTHTVASDGELTPSQLVKKAKQLKISYLAKTDHDTVNLMREFLIAGKKYKIHTIPGIEISSQYKNKSVHIVGLNIDYRNKNLIKYTVDYTKIRQQRAEKIIIKLKKLDWYIDYKQIQRQLIGRPHLALSVIKHPKNKKRLLKEFGHLPTFSEFIKKYIIPGKPAYIPKSKHISITQTIKLIHQANGLAILAHPYAKKNEIKHFNIFIENLSKFNFDGIEVYSPKHTINDTKKLIKLAHQHNFFISCGSDYHEISNELGKYNHQQLNKKI